MWCGGTFVGLSVRRLLASLALLAVLWPAAAAPRPDAPALSDGARRWLAGHSTWRVGVVREWMPIDGVDERGRHTGASAQVLAQAAARLGVALEAVPFDDFTQALEAARSGRVDLLSSTARTPQREQDLHFTQSYLRVPVAYIARRDSTDFSEADDFGGRTVAVERGYRVDDILSARFPNVRRLQVTDTLQALRAVAEGRADVYRGALTPAHFLIERDRIPGLRVLGTPVLDPTQLAFASRDTVLVEVLDAALRAIGEERLGEIERSWQPAYVSLRAPRTRPLPQRPLAGQEGELRVAYDAGFAPISASRADGAPEGLAVEMFRRSADAAGLRYRFMAHESFASALNALRRKEADVVVAAVRTPERLLEAAFVGPYYTAPSAIVSRLSAGWPTLGSLGGRRVAIDEEHYLIPVIRREHPGITLEVVPKAAGVLAAVDAGRADAGITNIEVASPLVAMKYVGRLRVSGLVESHPSELYFMVDRERPNVAEVLRRGFEAVPEDERRVLANALLRTNVTLATDWQSVALVGVPLLAGLTGLWLSAAWSARRVRRERDRAQQAAQMRADFVADMSHEVRTPLVALAEGLRLLEREAMPEPARRVLRPIVASTNRLVGLLNVLLDLAKLDAGKLEMTLEPVDLARLVQELAVAFEPLAAAKGVRLRVDVDSGIGPVMMDPYRVQQVVNNLVSNALKFTDQGEVCIALAARAIGTSRLELTLRVRDTGPGMAADVRERLFARFEQAPGVERQKGGTGLGLAIVQRLVRDGNGSISVNSAPGEGSEFVVLVQAERAPQAAAAPEPPQRTRRVLLVDDDPVNLLVFAEHLRHAGFEVEPAQTVAEAEQALGAGRFDLVLTDMNLGAGGRGSELAERAAASGALQGGALYVLSGDDAPERLPHGASGWLAKPRHPDDRAWLLAVERIAGAGVQP